MPAKPRWWSQIPRILESLDALESSWLDRSSLEQLFGVRRRRAIELLNAFGGFQAGRTFLIEREALTRHLRAVLEDRDFDWERRRRFRLSEALSDARQIAQARQVSIPTLPPSPTLPDGVRLAPGRLIIEFQGVQDLLAKFYAISQAAASDFEAFQKAVEPSTH
jgi:hypothetical protein